MTCSVESNCLNSSNCFNCCWDGDRYSEYGSNLYNNIGPTAIHPMQLERQLKAKVDKKAAKSAFKTAKNKLKKEQRIVKEEAKDKDKVSILKAAAKTETRVIATINSGRKNCDGDIKSKHLTVDVKLGSMSKDWHVKRDEYIKVQSDAARGNKDFGVLCIVNKLNEQIFVIPAELFNILLDHMKED